MSWSTGRGPDIVSGPVAGQARRVVRYQDWRAVGYGAATPGAWIAAGPPSPFRQNGKKATAAEHRRLFPYTLLIGVEGDPVDQGGFRTGAAAVNYARAVRIATPFLLSAHILKSGRIVTDLGKLLMMIGLSQDSARRSLTATRFPYRYVVRLGDRAVSGFHHPMAAVGGAMELAREGAKGVITIEDLHTGVIGSVPHHGP